VSLNTAFTCVKSHKSLYKGCIMIGVNYIVAIASRF
jgi:hypothetical protein